MRLIHLLAESPGHPLICHLEYMYTDMHMENSGDNYPHQTIVNYISVCRSFSGLGPLYKKSRLHELFPLHHIPAFRPLTVNAISFTGLKEPCMQKQNSLTQHQSPPARGARERNPCPSSSSSQIDGLALS